MKAPPIEFGVTADERAVLERLATGVLADPSRSSRLVGSVLEEIRNGSRPTPLDFHSLAAYVLDASRVEVDLVQVFRDNRDQLIALADRIVRDREHAEDLVHEVFARFLGAPSKLVRVQSLRLWVKTSVKNRCRDWLRRVRRAPAVDVMDEGKLTESNKHRDGFEARRDWIEDRVRRLDAPPAERDAALLALQHIAENASAILEAIDVGEISAASSIERFAAESGMESPWSPTTLRRYLRSVRKRLRGAASASSSDAASPGVGPSSVAGPSLLSDSSVG